MAITEKMIEDTKAADLTAAWQLHRRRCVKLAVKMGADCPEKAIEISEKISRYILNGKPAEQ